jgi:hypothetical protein
MPASALRSFQLVDAQIVDVINQTAQIYGITIACHAGTGTQHILVRDKGTPQKHLVPKYALIAEPLATDPLWQSNPRILEWTNGKMMDGGITIEATGTGTASVWIDYQTAPLGST